MFLVNFIKIKTNHKYLLFFSLLILWELIERLFYFGFTFNGFFPTNNETPLNVFSDLVIGFLGGFTFMKTGGRFFRDKF